MDTTSWARSELEGFQGDPEYELEKLLLDVNERIVERMDALALRKTDLARSLGVSRAFVTKLLSGNTNVTLATLVRVATALGVTVQMELLPQQDLTVSEAEDLESIERTGREQNDEVNEGVKIPLAA